MAFYCNGKKAVCECHILCADCKFADNTGGKNITGQTNLDWIREADEEELAELIYGIFDYAHNGSFTEYATKYGIREWLRQPKGVQ